MLFYNIKKNLFCARLKIKLLKSEIIKRAQNICKKCILHEN